MLEISKSVIDREASRRYPLARVNGEVTKPENVAKQCAFIDGVEFAMKRFKADVWHSSAETPKENCDIIIDSNEFGISEYYVDGELSARAELDASSSCRWAYKDDLMP